MNATLMLVILVLSSLILCYGCYYNETACLLLTTPLFIKYLSETYTYSGRSQLHPRCQRAQQRVAEYLPKYGKKWFKKEALKCTFCLKKKGTRGRSAR